MKYSEMIDLYIKGKLNEEQKEKVEVDIERQKAIGEYLFNLEEIPEWEEPLEQETEQTVSEKAENSADEFTKMINTAIRKAFLKTGIATGAVVMAMVLFAMFVLPKFVNVFYYDPSKAVANNRNDSMSSNQISLDLAVYSELFLPGYYRNQVIVENNGYGNYDINILQTSSMTGNFTNVAGKIEKNNLTLYDTNLLKKPFMNSFLPPESEPAVPYQVQELDKLDDSRYYIAYITLNQVMNYNEFRNTVYVPIENEEIGTIWCALCKTEENGYCTDNLIGFVYQDSCSELCYDTKKYPYLSLFDAQMIYELDKLSQSEIEQLDHLPHGQDTEEDIAQKHVLSMLRYLTDENELYNIIERNDDMSYYSELAGDIEEHGLNIYGFAVVAKKDTIQNIAKTDFGNTVRIESVFTTPYRY